MSRDDESALPSSLEGPVERSPGPVLSINWQMREQRRATRPSYSAFEHG